MTDIHSLLDQIRDFDWIIGAINYDEDLHFSSYYLRASTPCRTDAFYPGYGFIIGFYENFTERYYLKKDECIHNAEVLTRRALRDPTWLRYILEEIVHLSDALQQVFPSAMRPSYLADLTQQEILDIYNTHHHRQTELYTYARIPEALDRGVNYFTEYLRQYLTQRGLSGEDMDDAFNRLTQPVTPSVLAREILDFERIVAVARHDNRTRELLLSFPRKSRMLIPHGLVERVQEYTRKWRYIEYHGYGSRRLADESSVVERLVDALRDDSSGRAASKLLSGLAENRVKKDLLFEQLRIDAPHRELFELYPEIGAVKLHRRYAQIRNFFYLDMLLAAIASRLHVDEWTVRSALPEEIKSALSGETNLADAGERRAGCMYVLRNERETIIHGEQIHAIQAQLETMSAPHKDRTVLKGVIASRGKVQGTCKIVIRAEAEARKFQKGAILVSEATDPDLLKLLRIAGGVLTQQGGVTSHAAIICREIGVPAIIGIEGLLDTVKDGDVVELDAFTGTVSLVGSGEEVPSGILYQPDVLKEAKVVGGKAASLARLKELAFEVPAFVTLRLDGLVRYLSEASATQQERLRVWLQRRLSLGPDALVAIRSSGIGEDLDVSSQAGEFETLLNIPLERICESLGQFIEKNKSGKSGTTYSGSIVVQQMILGELGGVALTADIEREDRNTIVCEMSISGAHAVTSGSQTNPRMRIKKDTLDIVESTLDSKLEQAFGPQLVRELGKILVDIERAFQRAVDVEWVRQNATFYILQARPIVSAAKRRD